MRVRYYVMREGENWQVRREAKPQGRRPVRDQAIESAVFMASIEANRYGEPAEVFVEDDTGALLLERTVRPNENVGISLCGDMVVMGAAAAC